MNHSGTTYGLKSSASGLQRKREKGARNVKKRGSREKPAAGHRLYRGGGASVVLEILKRIDSSAEVRICD